MSNILISYLVFNTYVLNGQHQQQYNHPPLSLKGCLAILHSNKQLLTVKPFVKRNNNILPVRKKGQDCASSF